MIPAPSKDIQEPIEEEPPFNLTAFMVSRAQLYQKRRDLINKECRLTGIDQGTLADFTSPRSGSSRTAIVPLLYEPKTRVAYCQIPKVNCTAANVWPYVQSFSSPKRAMIWLSIGSQIALYI